MVEYLNKCLHVCLEEKIMVMRNLAVIKTVIVLMRDYLTYGIYSLIRELYCTALNILPPGEECMSSGIDTVYPP